MASLSDVSGGVGGVDDEFAVGLAFGTDVLVEVNHHRGMEEVIAEVFVQAEEVLDEWVLADLMDGFLVGDAKALFDDERSQRDAAFLGGGSHAAEGQVEIGRF